MKKSLLALITLTASCVALAQSSVTLFGVVDASVSGYSSRSNDERPVLLHQRSIKLSRTALSNSAYNPSRLGFRGTEDLGGGLAASFWLEAPITNDDGATGVSSFTRRSTVSLSGDFGEIRLGRDYTPTFWSNAVFDPFGANGVGTNLIHSANNFNATGGTGGFGGNQNVLRASNSIGYFLPPILGGFYGQLQYAFHEQTKYDPGTATPVNALGVAAPTRAGRYVGGRLGYANKALDIAVAYGNSTSGDQFYLGTTDSVKTMNLGASYDFGPVKLFGELSHIKNSRDYAVTPIAPTGDADLRGYLLGVTVPIGAGLVRASYSRVRYDRDQPFTLVDDPKASKLSLGYVHNLSKRTALYATIARVSNKNGAALTVGGPAFISNAVFTPGTSSGYDLGIRHAF
uniref:Porin Gram-negative type n=1 Tax=Variovorax paradoxus (strain S110) TaxID=543728 RepID=C5CKH4_VARPS